MRPLLLRPPFFVSGSVRLFSGFVFVTSSKVGDGHEAAARARRLVLCERGIQTCAPSKISIVSPSLELDDRLLPAGARALAVMPRRFGFGCTLTMFTRATLTLEELLDGLADLRLVRVLVHPERVLAVGDAGCSSSRRRPARAETSFGCRLMTRPSAGSRSSADSVDEQRARPDDRRDLDVGRRPRQPCARGCGGLPSTPPRRRCATTTHRQRPCPSSRAARAPASSTGVVER